MNIFIVSAEVAPFAKVGGLADVVGSLPAALKREGVDVRVIMPGYSTINHEQHHVTRLFSFPFTHRRGTTEVHVYTTTHDGVPIYFVQGWPYFGSGDPVYTDWDHDVPRFIFFNQVVMAVAWELARRLDWFPDVFHVNDWHTSLVPFLLSDSHWKQEWSFVASVSTIHNIGYQGNGVGGFLWDAGIARRSHPLLDRYGLSNNLLAIGIVYADMVNTVSPTYATEIQYAYAGYEMAPLMRERAADLMGILNGIDVKRWNPATDPTIAAHFDASNFAQIRIENKRHLQSRVGLPVSDEVPLIGVVSRLTWQKGFDLAIPALRQLLADTDVQFVVLGTGEPELEHQLQRIGADFGDKARAYIQFDAALAQHIYAGSDMFLMPSHFEPCGIGQMAAMRYGSLPVVRKTGGLADTVSNYDNGEGDVGTGFVFEWEQPEAVLGTLRWAIETYYQRPEVWRKLQQRAMQQDLSWEQSAKQYIQLYEKAIQKRKDKIYAG